MKTPSNYINLSMNKLIINILIIKSATLKRKDIVDFREYFDEKNKTSKNNKKFKEAV